MSGNLTFVTGANKAYFPILCAFLESFSEFCDGERITVCDFGLSAEQSVFLQELGLLQPRPSDIPPGLRSFYYKASIGRYLEKDTFEQLVWIDCDCLVLDYLGIHLRALSEMLDPYGDYVAVASDHSGSIEDFILRHGKDPDGTAPFKVLMNRLGLSVGLDYLNSAVFLLKSRKFLDEWHRLSFDTPFHVLFEQNIFNCLAYQGFANLHLLDTDVWNGHDLSLNRMKVGPGDARFPFRVFLDDKKVFVAHATSFMQKAIAVKDISLEIEGRKLNGFFKFILNPQIQKLQVEYLLRFIKKNKNLLLDCGVLQTSGEPDQVMSEYEKGLALNPDSPAAIFNLAAAYARNNHLDRAVGLYRSLLDIKPDHVEALINLGNILDRQRKVDESRGCYQRALEWMPDCPEAYYNLGVAAMHQDDPESAIHSYRKAVELRPGYVDAFYNMGIAWKSVPECDRAIESFDQALKLSPEHAEAHLQKAFTLLLSGRYEEGWREFEWRSRVEPGQFYDVQPQWDGSILERKTILVDSEQGLGDVLQFVRYLPLVRARCGKVIFACDRRLIRLLKNFPGIDELVEKKKGVFRAAPSDAVIPLLSLPGIFRTTIDEIPSTFPYIKADPLLVEQWRGRIDSSCFNVGLVWGSGPRYPARDCPLKGFHSLSGIPGVRLYSLQKGPQEIELRTLQKEIAITDFNGDIQDMADTAALTSLLDLVISVDTSVAHLAGAMAKRVWTLLPHSACWRYTMSPDSTPWYPSMRLFRQTTMGDWTHVITEAENQLRIFSREKFGAIMRRQ